MVGYKGYVQLAIRSGQYKKINVLAIKEGELVSFNPLTEDIEVKMIENDDEREKAETIGYYAMFEYLNGFRKAIYWTKKKMTAHATKYSKGYAKKSGYTFWEKDFDGMACKTMLRQLISKWGVMSIEMQRAFENDNAVVDENGNIDYIDNENHDENAPNESTESNTEVEATGQSQEFVEAAELEFEDNLPKGQMNGQSVQAKPAPSF
jgi:recombination protein RecT